MGDMQNDDRIRQKISYLAKEATRCPVCGHQFFFEKLRQGGGRLIAGDVTEVLHRIYKPSEKYGKIYPLAYSIQVCPDCFYAAFPRDFMIIEDEGIKKLKENNIERIDYARNFIDMDCDFSKHRTLETGAVSYALSLYCYDYFGRKKLPRIKQAISAMRAAYLFDELDKEYEDTNYNIISEIFFRKAYFLYKYAMHLNIKKTQIMENYKPLGPDVDKDYGYDGIRYLIGVLGYKYLDRSNEENLVRNLETLKMDFGKLFGMGKSNFDKPKIILDKSKDYYDLITDELKKITGE